MQDDSTNLRYCPYCFKHKPVETFGAQAYCRPCFNEYHNIVRNPYTARARQIKKKYGITIERYEKMVWDQEGLCAICGEDPKPVSNRKLVIDHDHATGIVRGLLCNDCNRGLGSFRDDPDCLRRAAEYIESHCL